MLQSLPEGLEVAVESSLILTSAIFVMFTLSTYCWASTLSVLIFRINLVLMQSSMGDLYHRFTVASNSTTAVIRAMQHWMFSLNYLVGDALIAWRVSVIYQRSLKVTLGLVGIWLGTLSCVLGFFVCTAKADYGIGSDIPQSCSDWETSAWLVSLVFNSIATFLLFLVARQNRKRTRMIDARRKTKVDRVLHILVVAGIVYVLIGLPRLSDFANQTLEPFPTKVTFATQIISDVGDQVVGLYPTAVTVLLMYEKMIFGDSVMTHATREDGSLAPMEFHATNGTTTNGRSMLTSTAVPSTAKSDRSRSSTESKIDV